MRPTLAEPREDRLKLMLACDAQFSSILALYSDEKPTLTNALREHVSAVKPKIEAKLGEYGTSKLWAVTDPGLIAMTQDALSGGPSSSPTGTIVTRPPPATATGAWRNGPAPRATRDSTA